MMDDKRWWWLGLMVHDEGFSGDEWRWCLVTGLNDDGSKPMDDDEDGNSDDDAECRGRLFIGDLNVIERDEWVDNMCTLCEAAAQLGRLLLKHGPRTGPWLN